MSFQHLDDEKPFVPDGELRAAALHEGRRRHRRRLSLAAGSAAAAVFVAGLMVVILPRGSTPDRVDTPPVETPTTTSVPSPTTPTTPMVSPPTTSTVPATTTTTSPPVDVGVEEGGYWFTTPSGNISCVIGADAAACDANTYVYDPGPAPADCPLDWGYRVQVSVDRPTGFSCSSDSLNVTDVVVPYGSGVRSGSAVCRSEVEGVTCTLDDGRGFFISRGAYRFF